MVLFSFYVETRVTSDSGLTLRRRVRKTDHSSYLSTPELHLSIFIKQQQQACWDHPRPGRSERSMGPLSEREGSRDYSQTALDEREAMLNTSHKVYKDRSLAFYGAKTICQQG